MSIRLFAFLLLMIIIPLSAQAQQCGKQPVDEVKAFKSEAEGHCGDSIYTRQFEYRKQRLEMRRMIEERREAYIQPALENYSQYERDLAALNAARSEANDVTSW